MCESTQNYSTHGSKIKAVVVITHDDLSDLINSIPKEEMLGHLPDAVLEEWAASNGYVKP